MNLNSYISNSKAMVIKRALAVIATLALLVGGIFSVQEVTRIKTTEITDLTYRTFFENPEQYDVVFFGTSHVLYGISPFDIWDECRITSYNWASPACTIPSDYWKLINILDYHTPRVVVVDCYDVTTTYKSMNEYRLHEAFDGFPLSYHKYLSIKDLMYEQKRMEDGMVYSREEEINLLFPISAYHSRWDSLEEVDFKNDCVDTKGASLLAGVAEPIEISDTTEKTEISSEMVGVTYLKKIVEECNNRDISVLFVYIPFPVPDGWKMEANMVHDLADECGVEYVDFTELNVVDYDKDCYDSNSHLNLFGQEKVSRYIGRYIADNYNVQIHSSNTEIGMEWDELYEQYKVYRNELIKRMPNEEDQSE